MLTDINRNTRVQKDPLPPGLHVRLERPRVRRAIKKVTNQYRSMVQTQIAFTIKWDRSEASRHLACSISLSKFGVYILKMMCYCLFLFSHYAPSVILRWLIGLIPWLTYCLHSASIQQLTFTHLPLLPTHNPLLHQSSTLPMVLFTMYVTEVTKRYHHTNTTIFNLN